MPIFVAGTGRCGTTQLNKILGEHPEISSLRNESRFIIDPGGLEDLVRALTTAYTPAHAEDALNRFEALLTTRLTGREDGPFIWFDLAAEAGEQWYGEWASGFLAALTSMTFDIVIDRPDGGPDMHLARRIGGYFPDRGQLTALCRRHVDALFSSVAARRGKRIWCEKTPLNLLSMAFLWELFPDATIIHIMRHPVAVVASFTKQRWTPDDAESVCAYLEPVYRRWLAFRDGHPGPGLGSRYIEVRLEDLAADWPAQRAALFSRLGLADAETASTMESERTGQAGHQLSAADVHLTERRLGFAIKGLGY
jgi:omega-hydroxy-beta-dihydromenaquinone-9 sulfotransferase